MNRILLFYALAGLLALVVSQGFIESCWEMELGQAQLLFSRCRQTTWKAKEKGHLPFYRSTVLELGRCYGNDNGKLKRQDFGNSHSSCGRCMLENRDDAIWWNCICPKKAGKWLLSRVDLNKGLRNDDGYLCCGGSELCNRDVREAPYEPEKRGIEGPLDGAAYNVTVRGADPALDAEWEEAVAGLWDATWDESS